MNGLTKQTLDVRTLGGIFGRAQIPTGAGVAVVASGAEASVWNDQIGASTTSNLTQTTADSNLFGGRIPNGEVYTLFGWQVQIFEVTSADLPVDSTALIHESMLDGLSMTLHMKGQEYVVGSVIPSPSGLGSDTLAMNGGRAVAPFRFPAQLPIQLVSNDQWFVTFTAKSAITLTAADNKIEIFMYCPASRGIPITQLSGA